MVIKKLFSKEVNIFVILNLGSNRRQQKCFSQGDVVELFFQQNDKNLKFKLRGWINYLNEYEISVIIKTENFGKIPEDKLSEEFTMMKLYDCTFRQVFDVLNKFQKL